MSATLQKIPAAHFLREYLSDLPHYFSQPIRLIKSYNRRYFRADLIAGATVGAVLLPQAIVFALLAGLPPQMGLYSAIIGTVVAALWGSSHHLHSGPTNTASLLVLSTLQPIAATGSPEYILAAGLLAVMVGVFRLAMGLARLGLLVNFVSDSVVTGFAAGAGVLIAVGQLRSLLGLSVSTPPGIVGTLSTLTLHVSETHLLSLAIGIGTLLLVLYLKRYYAKLPGLLIALMLAALIVGVLRLADHGVKIIGTIPQELPPLARLPLFDVDLIGQLSTGALALAIIGLVEATSIARSIASQSGQRLDSNQEFVGQGLANILCGFFTGYSGSGSFNRSALSYGANAQTSMAAVFSGIFVLVAMLVFAPLAVYIPNTSLAAMLILASYGMIDHREMMRIWRGAPGDAIIMVVTVLATILLPLQFAVLAGILMSLTYYILKTSVPRVYPVLPDANFKHFDAQPGKPVCPQLNILKISGDLYFGAVNHVEESIRQILNDNPGQRFLLLRMHGVNQCDISGIHMLEAVSRLCKDRGGDLFFMKTQLPVMSLMKTTGFYDKMGADHFLEDDIAISHLFYKALDPAVCIYECPVRAFMECQNLPKQSEIVDISFSALRDTNSTNGVAEVSPRELWDKLRNNNRPSLVVDVREPREFREGHIPQAKLFPLGKILTETPNWRDQTEIVLVCRSGRRSKRAASFLQSRGCHHIAILQGGMLAWEAAGFLEAVDL